MAPNTRKTIKQTNVRKPCHGQMFQEKQDLQAMILVSKQSTRVRYQVHVGFIKSGRLKNVFICTIHGGEIACLG